MCDLPTLKQSLGIPPSSSVESWLLWLTSSAGEPWTFLPCAPSSQALIALTHTILQQASLPVTQSIHLLPNSSCLGHRGNEAMKVMRLEEHHAMQNPFWCQLVKAEAPLLLLHSPTMKVAVLKQSNFSVNLNSTVFSALSFFPSVPDHHKEV